MTLAGFGRRLAATAIDILTLLPVLAGLLYLVYGEGYFRWLATQQDWLAVYGPGDAIINNLLPVLFTSVGWLHQGATPGKWLLGCRVVDATSGGPLTLRQGLFRNLGYLVSFFTFGLGFLWIAWDPRRQGFHDKIANTLVVRHPPL